MADRFDPNGIYPGRGTFAWRDVLLADHSDEAYWRGLAWHIAKKVFGWAFVYGILALVVWAGLVGWRIP